jgi:hypothetical protein
MSVCVFLGGFGFGNLGDEACLETSFKLYRLETNCAFTVNPVVTGKVGSFDLFFRDIKELFDHYPRIDRVVIAGGGVGFNPSFKDNLDWALRCKTRGAEVVVHNIGIGKIGNEWALAWPYLVPVLAEAKSFSVRDFRSKAEVESWDLGLSPEVSFYPERNLEVRETLREHLPVSGEFIGVSINNRPELWDVIKDNRDALRQIFASFRGSSIVPVVSTIHEFDSAEHDNVGFARFVDFLGIADRVVFPQACDRDFWLGNIGPSDIKYVISRCRLLVSARKHNIIHAIGARVPFIGVFEFNNDSIPRVFQTLFNELPHGSSLYPLYPS